MSSHHGDQQLDCEHCSLCRYPWQCITVAGSRWIVKSVFSEQHYDILFSDFTNVWHEQLQGCDVERRSKEINPSLEIDLSKLLSHIQSCVTEGSDSSYDVCLSSQSQLILTVTSKLLGLPFSWKFTAASVSVNVIRHHLTEPLMAMVSELSRQKHELVALLTKKDREIADLKAQGINVSRKKLETAAFNEASFDQNALQSKTLRSSIRDAASCTFSTADVQLLYGEIMKVGEYCSERNSQTQDEDSIMDGCSHDAESTATSTRSNSPTKASPRRPSRDQTMEIEIQRRQALEKRLAEQEKKDSLKKRKKIKF